MQISHVSVITVAMSALRASVLLPKDFLFPSKIFSFVLVSWFSPLMSVFGGFLWPAAGSRLLLSGGQALLASRPVACFSSQVFHSFSCRSGLSSADLELIPRCSFSLSNAQISSAVKPTKPRSASPVAGSWSHLAPHSCVFSKVFCCCR
jgi:hypothetical protein